MSAIIDHFSKKKPTKKDELLVSSTGITASRSMNNYYNDGTRMHHDYSSKVIGVSKDRNDFNTALDKAFSEPINSGYHCNYNVREERDISEVSKDKSKKTKKNKQHDYVHTSNFYADDGIRVGASKTKDYDDGMEVEVNSFDTKHAPKPIETNSFPKKEDHFNYDKNGCLIEKKVCELKKLSDERIGILVGELCRADNGYAQFITLTKVMREIHPTYMQSNL